MKPPFRPPLAAVVVACALLCGCTPTRDVAIEPLAQPAGNGAGDGDGAGDAPQQTRTALYPMEVATTAEQLYGAEPGGGSEAWRRAVEQNEALRYNVIYFDYNSSAVSDEVRRVLSHHTGFLEDNPAVTLRIEGHADERGSAGYNLALGEQRAKSVRAILQAGGVEAARVSVISYGEERPAVDGYTEQAYSRNRRAELIYQ